MAVYLDNDSGSKWGENSAEESTKERIQPNIEANAFQEHNKPNAKAENLRFFLNNSEKSLSSFARAIWFCEARRKKFASGTSRAYSTENTEQTCSPAATNLQTLAAKCSFITLTRVRISPNSRQIQALRTTALAVGRRSPRRPSRRRKACTKMTSETTLWTLSKWSR